MDSTTTCSTPNQLTNGSRTVRRAKTTASVPSSTSALIVSVGCEHRLPCIASHRIEHCSAVEREKGVEGIAPTRIVEGVVVWLLRRDQRGAVGGARDPALGEDHDADVDDDDDQCHQHDSETAGQQQDRPLVVLLATHHPLLNRSTYSVCVAWTCTPPRRESPKIRPRSGSLTNVVTVTSTWLPGRRQPSTQAKCVVPPGTPWSARASAAAAAPRRSASATEQKRASLLQQVS